VGGGGEVVDCVCVKGREGGAQTRCACSCVDQIHTDACLICHAKTVMCCSVW